MPGAPIPEEVLIDLLRSGEKSGLSYLYDHYSRALYGVIIRIVGKEAVAEEVLQDVFIKIWDRFNHYDPSRGRLFTWMVNIARNQAIDRTRSKEITKDQKTGKLDPVVSDIDHRDFTEQNVDAIGLTETLKSLPDDQRFVVEQLYLKGYTQSEVAEEFNIPLGTVKTRLRLAMLHLRAKFGVH